MRSKKQKIKIFAGILAGLIVLGVGAVFGVNAYVKSVGKEKILTSQQAHPTQNQLQFVRTAKARSKIRNWLTQHDPTFDNPFAKTTGEALQTGKSNGEANACSVGGAPRGHKKGQGNPHTGAMEIASGSGKIRIGDTTNFLVSRAHCCNPQYGDEIVGYVSRGRGIIIHRMDCHVFNLTPNRQERTLEVEWDRSKECQ